MHCIAALRDRESIVLLLHLALVAHVFALSEFLVLLTESIGYVTLALVYTLFGVTKALYTFSSK